MDRPKPRQEAAVLAELRQLCTSKGYIHAIAALCARDNFISHSGTILPEKMLGRFSEDTLIRSEIGTLIGLLVSEDIDFAIPNPNVLKSYIERSDSLLRELHDAINAPLWSEMAKQMASGNRDEDFLSRGSFLREPIFYSSESAYNFQFRDMAALRYERDEHWLKTNKGFTANEAATLFRAIMPLQNERLAGTMQLADYLPAEHWTSLIGFTFASDELAEATGMSQQTVDSILAAFTLPRDERNAGFVELNDYNITNTLPLISIADSNAYILLQPYSLFESLYDSPFYWMLSDPTYVQTASKNRGSFTEMFCVERLQRVFGPENVHQNVLLQQDKHIIAGEIDVLVVFANRCLVLQAKSKRLTIPARKGNEGAIRSDFQKSVQASYDQAFECAQLLLNPKYAVVKEDGSVLNVSSVTHIHPLCVIADHYPALSFQVRQFLQTRDHPSISKPFVLDVFTVDVLAEFLTSPLRFLSYVERRTRYDDLFSASHELIMLAYHLKNNLWSDGSAEYIALQDDVSVDLDMAMYARRDGAPAPTTPDGLLTHFEGTHFASLIESIEQARSAQTIELGFLLLEFSGNAIMQLNAGMREIIRLSASDGLSHDFSIGIGRSGLTVHCSSEPDFVAKVTLQRHVQRRKYISKADTWFGLCLDGSGAIRFGVNLKHLWKHDYELAAITANSAKVSSNVEFRDGRMRRKKVGRNELCPCGSGKKFKRCCLQ